MNVNNYFTAAITFEAEHFETQAINLKKLFQSIDGNKVIILLDDENNIILPKMLKNYDGGEYDFSYSGLKTAVINYVHNQESKGIEVNKADVACSFQHSAIDVLVDKAILAQTPQNTNNTNKKGVDFTKIEAKM
mgnify:CR=1 FL=1